MQEHVENPERELHADESAPPGDLSRWLAAASYLFLVNLFVLYEVRQNKRDDFVRFHARQGFALCFVEVVLIVVALILESSLGTIRYLGAIIMISFKLVAGLAAVGLSVWGFVEALGGERLELPVLGSWAKRVPLD